MRGGDIVEAPFDVKEKVGGLVVRPLQGSYLMREGGAGVEDTEPWKRTTLIGIFFLLFFI